jgi:hypothetical protein
MVTDLCALSDVDLDCEVKRVASIERKTTSELLRLLVELERRGLHLALGYSSLFAYCTRALRLSEQAAYSRITAARAARRFPRLLDLLVEGSITLSGAGLLAPHLTDETADLLLDASRFKATREIERMLAGAFPQPDIPTKIRALPAPSACPVSADSQLHADPRLAAAVTRTIPQAAVAAPPAGQKGTAITCPRASSVIAPIAPTRYLLKVTLSEDTEHKLQRARALLRHTNPDGDLDAILNRALTLLLDRIARTKAGQVRAPRVAAASLRPKGRRIPAAIRREVFARDGGRCVFVGTDGLCGETAFVEFHHLIPFAEGGSATAANLELRCRAHNAYEAAVHFGSSADRPTRRAPS